jgi:type II secretory pathway component GspD/PulD (secretin)
MLIGVLRRAQRRPSCEAIAIVSPPSRGIFVLALALGAFGLGNVQPAAASEAAFNIPSQPLAGAIQAFSQASGVEVLYESSLAAGRRSAPVEGHYSPEQALSQLLGNAGFSVRFTRADAVVLSLPSAKDDLPATRAVAHFDLSLDTIRVTSAAERPDDARLRAFGETVQSEIETMLRKDATIRSGNYRIRVRLWIDPSRTVRHAELAQSTGDPARDAAIETSLQGFVISRDPPPNTPQPIRVILSVRSL